MRSTSFLPLLFLFTASMSLLSLIRDHLGPLERWPSEVLFGLFSYNPDHISSGQHLMTAILFFYGHGVPLELAFQFFIACAGQPVMGPVKHHFRTWYHIWDSSPETPHMGKYYNVWSKRMEWLNGSHHDIHEAVRPQPVPYPIGIMRTDIGPKIRDRLRVIEHQDFVPCQTQ